MLGFLVNGHQFQLKLTDYSAAFMKFKIYFLLLTIIKKIFTFLRDFKFYKNKILNHFHDKRQLILLILASFYVFKHSKV